MLTVEEFQELHEINTKLGWIRSELQQIAEAQKVQAKWFEILIKEREEMKDETV